MARFSPMHDPTGAGCAMVALPERRPGPLGPISMCLPATLASPISSSEGLKHPRAARAGSYAGSQDLEGYSAGHQHAKHTLCSSHARRFCFPTAFAATPHLPSSRFCDASSTHMLRMVLTYPTTAKCNASRCSHHGQTGNQACGCLMLAPPRITDTDKAPRRPPGASHVPNNDSIHRSRSRLSRSARGGSTSHVRTRCSPCAFT